MAWIYVYPVCLFLGQFTIGISVSSFRCSHIDVPTPSQNINQETTVSYERISPKSYKPRSNPVQRMSERSILNSGLQRIQEEERKRIDPADDHARRIENGSYKIINEFHKIFPSIAPRKGELQEVPKTNMDVVVFPGPTSKSAQPYIPDIPDECIKTGICEDLPNYPDDRVAFIINGLGETKDKYKVDELDIPEIAQRIGPPEEIELCDFDMKVFIPKAAPDKDGNWHYILNQKEKPLQGFHVEICKEEKSCTKLVHVFAGYTASCKQKFVLRYMAGLNANGEMIEKPFKLPSCCSCVVRQD